MKTTTFTYLLSALSAATFAWASDRQPEAATGASPSSDVPAPTPVLVEADGAPNLELRQATQNNLAATQAATQAAIATTNWIESVLPNGVVTYVSVAYTQTFASIPDQWPSPGVGSIGLGTLKSKREAEPVQTVSVFAQPAVLVLRTALVLQPVYVATIVSVIETTTSTLYLVPSPSPLANLTSETGIFWGTGTANLGTGVFGPTPYGTAISS